MLPTLISLVIVGAAATFHGLLLKYITDIEKDETCVCAKNWKRDFIKYYLVASLIFLGLSVVRMVLGLGNNKFTLTVSTVMQLLGLINLFVMFFYSQELKNKSCECSANWKRKLMNVYSLVMLAFFPIVTIILLALVLLSGKTLGKK